LCLHLLSPCLSLSCLSSFWRLTLPVFLPFLFLPFLFSLQKQAFA
jgi:hypothetical protein